MSSTYRWAAVTGFALACGSLSALPANAQTPSCSSTVPVTPGCTFAIATGRIEPSLANSPGDPVSSYFVSQTLLGFSHADDEVFWRGKYVSGAHSSSSPGVLKISAGVSGRYEEDILDRPRLANAFAQSLAWYYDRITITVAGASFGQDALIHASILPLGTFSQVYDNLKGPADGYPLTPSGILAFDLGASQFQSSEITGTANDLGRVNLNVQFNSLNIPGYRVQHAVRSTETSPSQSVPGDPFGAPLDFVIRFKSGVPFYLQAVANMSLRLEMTTAGPKVQPVGSISDLHGLFGDSLYWNGMSDAKIGGQSRAFSVVSASGVDWSRSMAPDADADGVADGLDNCPGFANPAQGDVDGNGRGDVCECGDQDGDGRVDVRDLIAINQAIFEPARVTPLCDATNDQLCNVADIVAANRTIFAPKTSVCARQPLPGP